MSEEMLDIVFDGPPSHESGRFVEVENMDGKSVRVGRWIERDDGYWVLRMSAATQGEMDEARIQHILDIDIPAWQASGADWFTVRLLGLIAKADLTNRERLKLGFPEEVEAYERWLADG